MDEESCVDEAVEDPPCSLSMNKSNTVLPTPFASLISLTTSVSSLGIRVGGFVANAAIDGARIGTLSSFELGRVILEGILARAGDDVAESSLSERGRRSAVGVLERALSALHYSVTHTSFLISTGFQIGSTSLASGLAVSQYFLSGLDAIFGNNATSKAVATIVSLIHRELQAPEIGVIGETVSLGDLLAGVSSFALLQKWGHAKTEREINESGVVETVWDLVVVSDDNEKRREALTTEGAETRPTSFVSATGRSEPFEAVEDRQSFGSKNILTPTPSNETTGTSYSTEEPFRRWFADQLEPGSSVRFLAESRVTDRIEIEIIGNSGAGYVDPPPGFRLVAIDRRDQNGAAAKLVFQKSKLKRRRGSFSVSTSLFETLTNQTTSISDNAEESFKDSFPTVHLDPKRSDEAYLRNIDPGICEEFTFPERHRAQPDSEDTISANEKRLRKPMTFQLEENVNIMGAHELAPNNSALPADKVYPSSSEIDTRPLRKMISKGKTVKKLVNFWNQDKSDVAVRSNRNIQKRSPTESHESARRDRTTTLPCHRDTSDGPAPYTHGGSKHDQTAVGFEPRFSKFASPRSARSSTYSVTSGASDVSLVLHRSPVHDESCNPITQLRRHAMISTHYPQRNFASNLARFARFSLASYGPNFLRFAGTAVDDKGWGTEDREQLPQHYSFSIYNNLPASSVLLSSYVDPHGALPKGNDSEDSGLPLIHYVILDHEYKAVVLACRGTLGFEDVLTDMTAESINMSWQSQIYQVHQGVHASAKRLLKLHGSRLLVSIKQALEKYEDYGLVLCGHSLGGAVAAMLAILLAKRSTKSAGGNSLFVTYSQPLEPGSPCLPPNRPIHAYAYGPAACVSPALQRESRSLITSIVYGDDIVPSLSLGTLRDFQAVALAFKIEANDAKAEVRRRVWKGLIEAFRERSSNFSFAWPANPAALISPLEAEEDYWAWSALRSLRASLLADKLVPPGEVFHVEAEQVLQRYAFVPPSRSNSEDTFTQTQSRARRSFKPATRLTVRLVKDVERRFGEVRFASGMFTDHFPLRYLRALEALERGIGY